MAVKTPTPEDFLRGALDSEAPEALRVNAASEAAWRLKERLAAKLLELFPDFYWAHSEFMGVEGNDYVNLRWPQARRWDHVDRELTEERQRSLQRLGFTHVDDELIGVCEAERYGGCLHGGDHG